MNRLAAAPVSPLGEEAESVLAVLLAIGTEGSARLNELAHRTGLPTGHVGRHLRTLERDRLVRYAAGTWQVTGRGVHHAGDGAGPDER